MINGLIEDLKKYQGISKELDEAILFIRTHNLNDLPLNKSVISENITITRLEYIGKEQGISFPEEHRKHLDLQILTKGQERCYFDYIKPEYLKNIKTLYDEEKDVIKYDVILRNSVIMDTNNFTLFFPGDIHLPSQKIDDEMITKFVIKILIK